MKLCNKFGGIMHIYSNNQRAMWKESDLNFKKYILKYFLQLDD